MRKLYVPLLEHELALLRALATTERRRPQDQAAVLLTQALNGLDGDYCGKPVPHSTAAPESVAGGGAVR